MPASRLPHADTLPVRAPIATTRWDRREAAGPALAWARSHGRRSAAVAWLWARRSYVRRPALRYSSRCGSPAW